MLLYNPAVYIQYSFVLYSYGQLDSIRLISRSISCARVFCIAVFTSSGAYYYASVAIVAAIATRIAILYQPVSHGNAIKIAAAIAM
jgi:hypothetical protein